MESPADGSRQLDVKLRPPVALGLTFQVPPQEQQHDDAHGRGENYAARAPADSNTEYRNFTVKSTILNIFDTSLPGL